MRSLMTQSLFGELFTFKCDSISVRRRSENDRTAPRTAPIDTAPRLVQWRTRIWHSYNICMQFLTKEINIELHSPLEVVVLSTI